MIKCHAERDDHPTHAHATAADARACHGGAPLTSFTPRGAFVGGQGEPDPEVLHVLAPGEFACDWLIEIRTEDGPGSWPCGAPAREIEGGFRCNAGHEHVNDDVARRQGLMYCDSSDAHDATAAFYAGLEPRDMATGGCYDGPTAQPR